MTHFVLRSQPMELVKWAYVDRDHLITVRQGNHIRRARGGCTVWHEYPSGTRLGTFEEHELCSIWKRIEWGLENDKQETNS